MSSGHPCKMCTLFYAYPVDAISSVQLVLVRKHRIRIGIKCAAVSMHISNTFYGCISLHEPQQKLKLLSYLERLITHYSSRGACTESENCVGRWKFSYSICEQKPFQHLKSLTRSENIKYRNSSLGAYVREHKRLPSYKLFCSESVSKSSKVCCK